MKPLLVPLAAVLLLSTLPGQTKAMEQGTQKKTGQGELKPGEYTWEPPGDAPKGSVDIVVNLGKQMLFAYRNGVEFARSTISSGRKGYETPPGVYMILQKQVTHHSNKYHEASMPYMERLTWSGLAIHAGNTPAHPESHGCMHVPEEFSKKLYGLTEEGDTVLVATGDTKPAPVSGVGGLFADGGPAPKTTPAPPPGATPPPPFLWKPAEVTSGPYLIVFSVADKRVYVYRKGVEIGRADLGGADPGQVKGKHVYAALDKTSPQGNPTWTLLGRSDGATAPNLAKLAKRWTLPAEFRQNVRGIVAPGTTLVITDEAADNTKREGPEKDE